MLAKQTLYHLSHTTSPIFLKEKKADIKKKKTKKPSHKLSSSPTTYCLGVNMAHKLPNLKLVFNKALRC
jgi:hypothetical protein